MRLSPLAVTCTGIGGRPGSVIVHDDGSAVATTSEVTRTLSLFSARTTWVHFPVRSASEMAAAAGAGAGVATAESTGSSLAPAHADNTIAHASRAVARMSTSGWESTANGFRRGDNVTALGKGPQRAGP